MLIADTFNTEFACNALESLARQQPCPSAEVGAIELAAYALLFLTTPQPPVGMETLRLEDIPIQTVIKDWSSHGNLFEAYLAPWKREIAEWATNEQLAFLQGLENVNKAAEEFNGHDIETRPIAEMLPTPTEALAVLKNLARKYSKDTMLHVHAEFAVRALQYVIENALIVSFGNFLDDAEKPHASFHE